MNPVGAHRRGRAVLAIGVFTALAVSKTARADVVWPALVLERQLLAVWAIALGLVIEAVLVRWAFKASLGRTTLATLTANALSTVCGIIALPVLGGLATLVAAPVFQGLGSAVTGGVLWVLSFLIAVLVNTWIEVWIYRGDFRFTVGRREIAIIILANGLSVGVAALNYMIHRPAV